MRLFLPIALLLVSASGAAAQQAVVAAPTEAAQTAGPRAKTPAAPATVTAPEVKLPAKPAAEARAADEGSTARVQQIPRNFWWLVGGIVLAGVILAVLL